jgi:beta-glucanase (GH16 family)
MHFRVRKQARGLSAVVVLALGMGLLVTSMAPAGAETAWQAAQAARKAAAEAKKAEAAANALCGGKALKRADGTSWTCAWGDDFTGSLDTSKWFVQTSANSGYNAGGACYTDSKQNVTQSMGVLKLVARKVAKPFVCASSTGSFATNYSAATVSTFNRFTQAYGRFEVRAKFPSSKQPGLQSAIWMYPENTDNQVWPYSGEIDIAESYSQYSDRVIPFLHYGNSYLDLTSTNTNCKVANVGGAWHTYALEWTPASIRFIYDGKLCLENTAIGGRYPFNKPYMLVLSQLIGVGANGPMARTQLPATTQIDYVHVWK